MQWWTFSKKKKKFINVKRSLFWNLNTCNDKILCKENCFNFVLKRKSSSLSPNANNYIEITVQGTENKYVGFCCKFRHGFSMHTGSVHAFFVD